MATPQSIVIVEDECIAAEDMRRRLVSWGYDVPAVVATGEDAVRSAEQVRPDLVLMDIHLKGQMDGVRAAKLIREKLNVPVIYATAYNDSETLSRAGVEGRFEVVNKPYDDLEIRAAIELTMTRRRFEQRLNDLEARHKRLLVLLNEASQYGASFGASGQSGVNKSEVAGWASSEVEAPLTSLRRCVGSLNATELTSEQRDILERAEHSLHSLETLVNQIQH
jgi:CheY-like chemotaxis protein